MSARQNFLGSAAAVAECVGRIPSDRWERNGLGAWTVRDLVGHTSRAIVTVLTYLQRPCEQEDLPTAEAYLTAIRAIASPGADDQVAERGRQAGRDLGDDPASAFAELVTRAEQDLPTMDDERLLPTIAGGMRLASYLETRTFELVVHGGDISRATGVKLDLPAGALAESAALAGRVAVLQGRGPGLLAALTGRQPLPANYSVLNAD